MRDGLVSLYDWIAARADAQTAFEYTGGIEAHGQKLTTFPECGTPRDDLVPGVLSEGHLLGNFRFILSKYA